MTRTRAALAAALVAAGALLALAWSARRDPGIAYLPGGRGARWILYPHAARAGVRPAVELDTRFRRSFVLEGAPGEARLAVRAFRRFEVAVNGAVVGTAPAAAGDWKRITSVEIGSHLRAGENVVVATAWNDRGPPALWLEISWPGGAVATDGAWQASLAGATWKPARLATARVDVSPIDPEAPRLEPWAALLSSWRLLLILAGGAAAALLGFRTLRGDPARALGLAAGLAVAAWAALFVNDAPSLSPWDGYDAEGHLQYVQYLLDHHRLPSPAEGWSAFQPPLYYVITAGALKLAGLSVSDPGASLVVRGEGLLFGLAQLLLLLASLRLLFPDRPAAVLTGLCLVALLPAQLCAFLFVGNDGLAATLATAAVWLTLRAARRPAPSIAAHAAIGACLGAALLAKASVLPVVGVVVIALLGRPLLEARGRAAGLRAAAAACGTCLAVCGWHYGGVALRYGSPLAGNWDPRVLPPWWQDPGFVTASHFLRLRDALAAPVLSALNGIPQGLYSTLWGDGLIAGRTRIELAPPWDLQAMAAGYALALVPTGLAAVGAVVAARRWLREPDAAGFLLLGLAGATAAALALWPLRLPIYSVIKASFGLPAALALGALAGEGMASLARGSRAARAVMAVALATWAMNSYAAFWIPRGGALAHARLGWLNVVEGREAEAARHLEAALRREPDQALACLGRARLLARAGRAGEAEAGIRGLLARDPDHARAHLELALLLESGPAAGEALEHFREAARIRPWDAVARLGLARRLRADGEAAGAVEQLREALGTAPDLAEIHDELASLLAGAGEAEEAARHARLAARLRP